MRVSFNIDVSIDAKSYVQAGEVLDKITRDLKDTLASCDGDFDLRTFESHHNPVRKYSRNEMAMTAEMPMEEVRHARERP